MTTPGETWEQAHRAASEVAGAARAWARASGKPEAEAEARYWERWAELIASGDLTDHVLQLEEHMARLCDCLEEAMTWAAANAQGGRPVDLWQAAIVEARALLPPPGRLRFFS